MNAQYRATVLKLNPMHLSDENHDVLMDAASLREGLDYVEEIPDSLETSDDDNGMEEDDGTESESNEYTDSDDE